MAIVTKDMLFTNEDSNFNAATSTVAPVVITSSTIKTFLFLINSGLSIENVFWTLLTL
jgi:hypothetical protein